MGDAYRILVTGSRDWGDWRTITGALIDAADGKPGPVTVVHGCARGADFLAAHAARKLGWEVEDHPARWDAPCREECKPGHRRMQQAGGTYCPAAGNYRNQEMVDTGPAICLSFFQPGTANSGTSDCVRRAVAAGIAVETHGLIPQAIARLLAEKAIGNQTDVRLLWDN